MNNQYYRLSTDYDLADKYLKEGATLAAWLWKPNKQLYTFSITDGELFINGSYPPSDFTYEKYLVHFLLPIPDPTYELKTDLTEVQQQCSKLWHSLTQALNEADELRVKSQGQSRIMQIMETEIDSLRVDRANLKRLNNELREKLNTI